MAELYVVGQDDYGNDLYSASPEVGRSRRISRRPVAPRFQSAGPIAQQAGRFKQIQKMPAFVASQPPMFQALPGAPVTAAGGSVLNTTSAVFTSTSGSVLSVIAEPQKNFIGKRVIANITREDTNIAPAIPTNAVFLNDLRVGIDSQLVSAQPINMASMSNDTTGAGFTINPSSPGLKVNATFSIGGAVIPTATQSITVSLTIYGEIVR